MAKRQVKPDPKPPRGFAKFVAEMARTREAGENNAYDDIVEEWRAAFKEDRQPRLTQREIAARLNVPRTKVEMWVKKLFEAGRLTKRGQTRQPLLVPSEFEP